MNALERLLRFAAEKKMLQAEDIRFARNMLMAALRLDAPLNAQDDESPLPETATAMLEALCDIGVQNGALTDTPFARDQFGAHLMNLLLPPPSHIQRQFGCIRKQSGVEAATDWFYALCRDCDYIRVDQIARNVRFMSPSPYGQLEITINLSKPEKHPRDIEREKNAPQVGYPTCMLCIENEGYIGRPGYPSHETLRMIPVEVAGEAWYFQYSPYSYYDEHCIALSAAHVPMSITQRSFEKLLSLTDQFPHYFFGSNADLPIVGGSILGHDHFQGGRHVFPMDLAPAYAAFSQDEHPDVCIEAVRWPMTCLRLTAPHAAKESLVSLCTQMLSAWRVYDDREREVLHETDQPHNTITPIARRTADGYVVQLVLRNNRTSPAHPLGIFHPHAQLHHIKQENIGLIEVMGMFILPGRLLTELTALSGYLTGDMPLVRPADGDPLQKHYDWITSLADAHGTQLSKPQAEDVIRAALSKKCVCVLEDAGVFKANDHGDAGLCAFLASLGAVRVS